MQGTMKKFGLATLLLGVASTGAFAQIITDDFEVDTSGDYTVVQNAADGTTTFNYDYSVNGIPTAPNSTGGSTNGLRFTANDTAGVEMAITAFHNTAVNVPEFRLTVDVWMNIDANVTNGSTEHGHVGVAGDGSTVNSLFNPITGSGHFLAFTGEGGSSSDFRHRLQSGLTNSGDASYLNDLNTTNATGDTYQNIFSNANGYAFAGSPGNNWATLEIEVLGGEITYLFNGTPIISTSATGDGFSDADGNLVSLGYGDLFSSVAAPFQGQFVIYDNLTVEVIPEPASLALLGLGGLMMLRRRR